MPSEKKFQSVLFDIDGTLIDSNDQHAHAWVDVFAEHHLNQITYETIRGLIGMGGDQILVRLLPQLPDEQKQAIEKRRGEIFEKNYLPTVKPFPGLRSLFEKLKNRQIRIGLASSSGNDMLKKYIEIMGIGDLLEGATGKSEVPESKPSGDVFEASLRKFEFGRASTIVVG